jgi:hypothetical protein
MVRAWWIGPVHVTGYLVATFGWILLLGLALAAWLLLSGAGMGDPEALIGDGAVVSALTTVQLVGMAVLAVIGAGLLPSPRSRVDERLADGLSLRPVRAAPIAWGAALGLVVGLFPGWLMEQMGDWLGEPMISRLVGDSLDGPWYARVAIALAVAVAAPWCEELVFRGYLWSAIERSGPPALAAVVTTVLFAAFHLEPVHVLAVLPIAACLGFARWASGAVWAGIALHTANNTLALGVTWLVGDAEPSTPLWLALLGLALTLGGCFGLWRSARVRR